MNGHALVDTGVTDIPNRGALDHVPDCEAFDCLVLGYCTTAVGAAEEVDVPTAFLVAATISSFLGLQV
jgi:hypothetical protein